MEDRLYIRKEDLMRNRLEELRKQKGIRQEELAAVLKVSRQRIGSLENGRCNPSILLASKIAGYFEMSIKEVLIGRLRTEIIWNRPKNNLSGANEGKSIGSSEASYRKMVRKISQLYEEL